LCRTGIGITCRRRSGGCLLRRRMRHRSRQHRGRVERTVSPLRAERENCGKSSGLTVRSTPSVARYGTPAVTPSTRPRPVGVHGLIRASVAQLRF
jgi:hypothetical protein